MGTKSDLFRYLIRPVQNPATDVEAQEESRVEIATEKDGHVASTTTEMVGCTIVPDIANDAFIVNIQNTVMDNKTVQNVDLRERSTVPLVTYEYSSRILEWKN